MTNTRYGLNYTEHDVDIRHMINDLSNITTPDKTQVVDVIK